MRKSNVTIALMLVVILSAASNARAADDPRFWKFASTPPMGWNSYDTYGDSVTEQEVRDNAAFMRDHLKSHGWQYVVVDYRWYDPDAKSKDTKTVAHAKLTMDEYGRLTPAVNRFPSSAEGKGFGPLAADIHAMGLKFGIHIMRGIPRNAIKPNYPIQESSFHMTDAVDLFSTCPWNPDMFGIDASVPAGQAYYDSLLRLYAAWGVDFIKVDDLSYPYATAEIEAIRKAIDGCGRPIVFSTSPGPTPTKQADHIKMNANMWRISADFWDNWKSINGQFDLLHNWEGAAGLGHWPDADMIPIGHISVRSVGHERESNLTHDEQQTLMSLWCLAPSPLMLGMDMPKLKDETLSLLMNDEVLAIDQDAKGEQAKRISQDNGMEIWSRHLADGSMAVGAFNRSSEAQSATIPIQGSHDVREVWAKRDLGRVSDSISADLPPHGSKLFIVK